MLKHRPAPGHNHYPKEIAVMVTTHSIPTTALAQDRISRDFTQKDKAIRRVTVCNSLRDIQGQNGRPMRAPQLLLRGRWLQRAGFHVGVPVKVHVSRGRLVIERDRDRAPQDEVLTRIAQVTEGGLSKRDLEALVRRLKRDRID
jgi:Toxin SymE, type I toxin-antitoxin system